MGREQAWADLPRALALAGPPAPALRSSPRLASFDPPLALTAQPPPHRSSAPHHTASRHEQREDAQGRAMPRDPIVSLTNGVSLLSYVSMVEPSSHYLNLLGPARAYARPAASATRAQSPPGLSPTPSQSFTIPCAFVNPFQPSTATSLSFSRSVELPEREQQRKVRKEERCCQSHLSNEDPGER